MVGNSKVLTVSYGTFSCTLEGFDDSFDTMKAIAEYFRDLAAEDRFFGAEPPQPDADVLARIAERELARGVSAKAEGNSVLLTPVATAAPAAADAAEKKKLSDEAPVAAEAAPEPVAPVEAVAPVVAEAPAPVEVAQPEPIDEPAPVEAAEPEVAPEPKAPLVLEAPLAEAPEDNAAVEDTPDMAVEAELAPEAEIVAADDDDTPDVEEPQEEEPAAASAVDDAPEAEVVLHDDDDDDGDDNSFWDAVPTSGSTDIYAGEVYDDDAQGAADVSPSDILAKPPTAEEPVAEEPVVEAPEAETPAAQTAEVPADNDLAAKLRRIQAVVSASKGAVPDGAQADYADAQDRAVATAPTTAPTAEADVQAEPEAEAPAAEVVPERPRVLKMKRADFEAAMAAARAEQAQDMTKVRPLDAAIAAINGTAPGAKAAPAPQPEPQPEPTPAAEPEIEAEVDETMFETSLSAEDEAELLADLAAAEAEAFQDGLDDDDAPLPLIEEAELRDAAPVAAVPAAPKAAPELAPEPAPQPAPAPAATKADVEAAPEEPQDLRSQVASTMSRLMAETNAKLNEPSSQNRRNAYSHLKAAVAATNAARNMGEPVRDQQAEREGDFRADLAEVVRPKAGDGTGGRPSAPPLKLVASQRVDVAQDAAPELAPAPQAAPSAPPSPEPAPAAAVPGQPVRPRRVDATQVGAAEDAGSGFQSFVAQAGAAKLPDVLEAAIAYLTHVEGRSAFSRSLIMRTAQQGMGRTHFSREDGLRAFGALLRNGRIRKLGAGEFEMTETTRFQPEAMQQRQVG
ncbi:MAG: hypothetical protein AAF092_01780 [Pseudomonadota bacterium]